jgi:hypothetical protein
MNRPVRSPLAMRVFPQAIEFLLPVVPTHPISVRAALSAAPVATYDMGYAR